MNTQRDNPQFINALNRIAHCYELHAKWQIEIAQRLLEHLEPMRIAPKTILNLGCRTGYATRLLHKRFPKATIINLDWATQMLLQAKRQKYWWWQPVALCAAADKLPLPEQSIDLVFANLSLEESPNISQTLQEVRRVLRAEGLLAFATFGPNTLLELRQSWAEVDDQTHVYDFIDMHYWGDWLLQAGLLDPVMDREQLTVFYANAQQLWQDLKNTATNNLAHSRTQVLTSKQCWQKFSQNYEKYRHADGFLPITLEVAYGHAWGAAITNTAQADAQGEVRIPIQAIKKLSSKH